MIEKLNCLICKNKCGQDYYWNIRCTKCSLFIKERRNYILVITFDNNNKSETKQYKTYHEIEKYFNMRSFW